MYELLLDSSIARTAAAVSDGINMLHGKRCNSRDAIDIISFAFRERVAHVPGRPVNKMSAKIPQQ